MSAMPDAPASSASHAPETQSSLTASALARVRPELRAMPAYVVQHAAGLLKLDAMENPYPLPPALQAELGQRLGRVAINRYPGADALALRDRIGAWAGLPAGWGVMLGNGSDELISLVTVACAQPAASVLAPEPGFVMYGMSAKLAGMAYHAVDLRADFSLDVPALCAAIAQHRPAIVHLAYPNNPTANLWDAADVRAVIAAQGEAGGLVVIDEAYQPFAAHTWLDEVRAKPAAHGHVIVLRTLSKFGLAGVRLGYAMGPAALMAEIDKLRPPYNVSSLNAECALFALDHADEFDRQAAAIRAARTDLLAELARLPQVQVFPSEGNMVLIRVPDAATTSAGMRARGVLIKNVSTMHPLLAHCLRLTVGTPADNAQMLAALRASLDPAA